MVREQEIIQIDLSSLVWIDEIPVGAVDGVEGETGQVHGYEIEVHAFDTG